MNRLGLNSILILLTSSTGFAADAPTVRLHSAALLAIQVLSRARRSVGR
jgi:hypothetical protein